MSALAEIMLWVFIAAWCFSVAAHIYGTRYFLPNWFAMLRRKPVREGYGKKALKGYCTFIAAAAVALAAGGIAELAGGWG